MATLNRRLLGVSAGALIASNGRVPTFTRPATTAAAGAFLQGLGALRTLGSATLTPGATLGSGEDSASFRYIRAGASAGGNGMSWSTAWNSFGAATGISAGMTVWVAGGSYGAVRPGWNGTSGSRITIKAATNSSHGTNTGWSSAYAVDTGTNPVIFDAGGSASPSVTKALNLDGSNYVTVDGQVRAGLESGHGIVARNAYYAIHADDGTGSDGITLRYIDASVMPNSDVNRREDGIQGKGDDLVVEYCFIHDNDSGVTHGDGIQWFGGDRITLRYNVWKNGGQSIYLGDGGLNLWCNNVEIYYNLIYNRGGGHYNGILFNCVSSQATFNGGQPAYYNIYNNTVDLECLSNDGFNAILNAANSGPTIRFKNNAFRATNTSTMQWRSDNSNNAYDTSGTGACFNVPTDTNRVTAASLGFVAEPPSQAADFRIASSSPLRGAGINVGLTLDILGNPVPSTPDIGCFQYAA